MWRSALACLAGSRPSRCRARRPLRLHRHARVVIIVSVYMVSADSTAPLLTPLRHTGVVIIASVYMVSADSTAPLLTPLRHTGAHTGARGTLRHAFET